MKSLGLRVLVSGFCETWDPFLGGSPRMIKDRGFRV